ncbi:hypothetical protein [Ornithinimicrobium panacihumi]|uniref:hypothetical protein n=1 Tax=Ornithinimicrobium panacihumi TaxID=2008449 RepID=UPI003F8B0F45
MTAAPITTQTPAAHHDVRNAWMALLLVPLAIAGAFLVGEGLIAALSWPGDGARPPLWAILAATLPALAVFSVPALVSTWFARRVSHDGDRRGWVPAGLLIGATVLFVLTNVGALFA